MMMAMIRVQREDFDPAAEVDRLVAGNHEVGGVVTFTGLVRDLADGRALRAMTLEHYPGMTEKMLGEIEAEAKRRWPLHRDASSCTATARWRRASASCWSRSPRRIARRRSRPAPSWSTG